MKIFHHRRHKHLSSLTHHDFWNLELSVWLHTIGSSVTSIFVPVLMLTYGYPLYAVLAYCAVYFLLDTPLNFLARKLVIAYGAKLVVILGTLSLITYFTLFPYLMGGQQFLVLFVLAVLSAIYDSFYWVAHLYVFIESSGKKGEVGKNNGILNGIRSFGGMLGPAIGAGVLIFESSGALLGVSLLFLILSVIPLLAIRGIKGPISAAPLSFREFFEEIPERKNFIFWFLYSIHLAVNEIIWPIFIFSFFGTLESIALVAVLISVSKIVLSYVSGRTNVKNREHLIVAGIASLLFIWVIRLIYPSPAFYYLSILLVGFFTILIEVPLDSNIFERARLKNQSLNASTMRNAIIMFPQGVLFAILALLVGVFKISFISAIVSLAALLIINQAMLYFYKKRI